MSLVEKEILEVIERIKHNTYRLRTLNMTKPLLNDKTDLFFNAIKTNTTIETLNLNDIEGFSDISDALKTNKTLKNIELLSCTGSDIIPFFEALQTNPTLEGIKISNTSPLTGNFKDFENVFSASHTLKSLHFVATEYNARTYPPISIGNILRHNQSLTELNIAKMTTLLSNPPEEYFAQISEALENNSTLRILDLSYNQMSDKSARALSSMLTINKSLTELNISYTSQHAEHMTPIAKVVAFNKALKILNLKSNLMDDESAQALASLLENNKILTDLNISCTSPSPEHMTLIIRATETNLVLRSLDLSGNQMCNKSVQALIALLENNKTLTLLNIEKNKAYRRNYDDANKTPKFLKSEHICLIAHSISKNSTLLKLILNKNYLDPLHIDAFNVIFTQNSSLTELHLNHIFEHGIDFDDSYFTKVTLLLRSIQLNSTLKILNLDENYLHKKNIQDVAMLLSNNKTLTKLTLNNMLVLKEIWGSLYVDDIIFILQALFTNTALEELNMQIDHPTEGSMKKLNDFLSDFFASNKTLTRLNLGPHFFPVQSEKIKSAMERNVLIKERLQCNWGRVSMLTAFLRANANNALKYSILPLIPDIRKLGCLEGEVTKINLTKECINLDRFMDTPYFKSILRQTSSSSANDKKRTREITP